MAAAWNDVPATGGLSECAGLVRSAEALGTSAPEVSVQLARRALLIGATDLSASTTNAGEARNLSMRAQAVLAAGLVRISQHVGAVEPGFAALALAESGGALVLSAEIRLDLAACAQDVGEPLLGGALLRPVLEAGQAPPSVRAAALGRLVGCVAHVARRDDIEDALNEADRLLAADDGLSPDLRRIERARLLVRSAAYHRWYGDNEEAVTAARDGLTVLGRLRREMRSESDRVRARLVLELVCALLDEGERREAEAAARPTVDEPVRATSAASVGQLMLAVATRVHLPAGDVDRGRRLLDQAAWTAERHGLDSVLADALTEVSRLDEQAGRPTDALEAMRAARAAEQRRMRAVARAARQILVQVGASQGSRDVTQETAAALLRQLAHPAGVPVSVAPPVATRSPLPPPRTSPEPHAQPVPGDLTDDTDKGTGLLNREGLFRRLRSVRKGERPVALTLVRVDPNTEPGAQDRGPDTGIMADLAHKVRDMAPENAELARSDGGELAVLLPHTTQDEAEEFAATIRETATRSDWLADGSGKDMSLSTSVVQSNPHTTDDDPHMDAAGMLTAARDALTPAQPATTEDPLADKDFLAETKAALNTYLAAQASETHQPEGPAIREEPPTTPLNVATNEPQTAGRSVLNALSIPTGSGGRRRAPGEPPPGEKTPRPTESPEPARPTRAERRARESTEQGPEDYTPPTGWPAEPDLSQSLRPTAWSTRQKATEPATQEPSPGTQPPTFETSLTANVPPTFETSLPTTFETSLAENMPPKFESALPENLPPTFESSVPENVPPTFDTSLTAEAPAADPSAARVHPTADKPSTTAEDPAPEVFFPSPALPKLPELQVFGTPAPTPSHPQNEHHDTGIQAHATSSYEETRAELARMMSALNAKALRSRNTPEATQEQPNKDPLGTTHSNTTTPNHANTHHSANTHRSATATPDTSTYSGTSDTSTYSGGRVTSDTATQLDALAQYSASTRYHPADQLSISALWSSIPTPPEPNEMPEPPAGPDIPEPPDRPDIPEPPDRPAIPGHPDSPPIPKPPNDPAIPERPGYPPIPEPPDSPETRKRSSRPDIPGSDPDLSRLVLPEPGAATLSEPSPPYPHGESTRSRLMAAFDALTGPVPSPPPIEDTPHEPPNENARSPETSTAQPADTLTTSRTPADVATTGQPTTDVATTHHPLAADAPHYPLADETIAGHPLADQATAHRHLADETAAGRLLTDEAATHRQLADETAAGRRRADEAGEPFVDEVAVGRRRADEAGGRSGVSGAAVGESFADEAVAGRRRADEVGGGLGAFGAAAGNPFADEAAVARRRADEVGAGRSLGDEAAGRRRAEDVVVDQPFADERAARRRLADEVFGRSRAGESVGGQSLAADAGGRRRAGDAIADQSFVDEVALGRPLAAEFVSRSPLVDEDGAGQPLADAPAAGQPSAHDEAGEPLPFRARFDAAAGLPSRKPRKSWSELQSSATVDSPADNLFGAPAENTKARSSLSAAFADFDLGEPPTPGEYPPEPDRPAEAASRAEAASPEEPASPAESPAQTSRREGATFSGVQSPAQASGREAVTLSGAQSSGQAGGREGATLSGVQSPGQAGRQEGATFSGVQSPAQASGRGGATFSGVQSSGQAGGQEGVTLSGAQSSGQASRREVAPTTSEVFTTSEGPSGAQGQPSGASAGAVARQESTPTYDEPIGPERRPEGLPRRGERSATTIASLLTEALAAYQSSTDDTADEDESHRVPERFDSFLGTSTDANTIAGRHRSPE